jgi:hypothetical protein
MELFQQIVRMKLIVIEDAIEVRSFMFKDYEKCIKINEFAANVLLGYRLSPEDQSNEILDEIIRSAAQKFGWTIFDSRMYFMKLYYRESLEEKQISIARDIKTLSEEIIVHGTELHRLCAQKHDLRRQLISSVSIL